MCDRCAYRRLKRLWEEESRFSTAAAFEAYVRPLEMVMPFKYRRIIITASDNDWMAVVTNLKKAQKP